MLEFWVVYVLFEKYGFECNSKTDNNVFFYIAINL